MTHCRRCGAPIARAETVSGWRVELDLRPSPTGELVHLRDRLVVPAVRHPELVAAGRNRFHRHRCGEEPR